MAYAKHHAAQKGREAAARYRKRHPDLVAKYQQKWYKSNKNSKLGATKRRMHQLKYGISLEARDAIFAAQGFCCGACGSFDPGSKLGWVLDHNHETGIIRGVLCLGCNSALGFVKDNPDVLGALIRYIGK